ncbi:MAG TPA: PQQ-binding-like beta-propeller repeat protein [Bryobacteraceae bacterium]|nr:PQQ-binding-like beta-propeller repeat protein [Bryobacteraceae bacterium]
MRIPLLLAAVLPLLAQNAEWPQFRGPGGTGIAASSAAPPVEFSPSQRLLWKQALPIGHSSPAVWGDRIFLTSFDPPSKKLELICVSSGNGAILWRRVAPAPAIEETHVVSNPATATPTVDEERVYAYFSSYGVMAFDHSGKSAWTAPLPMPKTHHGSGASPILAGDLLIINHDAMQGEGYLLALDRRTGKETWRQPYPLQRGRVESYSTPMLWHDQLVLHRAGIIEAYQVSTGKHLWSLEENTSGASTVAATDDLIFAATWNVLGEEDQRSPLPDFPELLKRYDKNGDGKISADEFPEDLRYTSRPELESIPHSQNYVPFQGLDRNHDGILQQSEWDAFRARINSMAQDHGLLAIRPKGESATVVWRENSSIPEVPSPLLYHGRLFLVRNGGIVTCLDAASGKVIWRARAGAPGAYYASPIAANGRVYLASSEGVVTVLSADGASLEVLARNELGDDIVATPAIVRNVIYVRTLHSLYAFADR